MGTLDLFHATLGVARTYLDVTQPVEQELLRHFDFFQQRLFSLMGEVATSDEAKEAFRLNEKNRPLSQADIDLIDQAYAWLRETLNARQMTLKQWAVYGSGGRREAQFDLARAACRKAELSLWELKANYEIRDELVVFINRFSDLLFFVGRYFGDLETPKN